MRSDERSGKQKKEWREYMLQVCRDLNVDPSRVIYVGKLKKERREYVAESADLVTRFFNFYKIDKNVHVLYDGGRLYKEKETCVFDQLMIKKHLAYPSPVHQFISPNDNCYHGVGKKKWLNLSLDWTDDVLSSITLLHIFDSIKGEKVRGWFQQNMLAIQERADTEKVMAPLTKKLFDQNPYFRSCLRKYWELYNPDMLVKSRLVDDAPVAIESTFDGAYWTEWERD